jgi:hypothetical protein
MALMMMQSPASRARGLKRSQRTKKPEEHGSATAPVRCAARLQMTRECAGGGD